MLKTNGYAQGLFILNLLSPIVWLNSKVIRHFDKGK